MKTSRVLFITICIICIMMTFGCDPERYYDYWFVNKTGHKINVDTYCFGSIENELSFIVGPYDSTLRTTWSKGAPLNPFIKSTCIRDSILLVFNDTLSLNTSKYLEFAPFNNIERLGKTKFRYEFTEAHYQKALEVNGFLK